MCSLLLFLELAGSPVQSSLQGIPKDLEQQRKWPKFLNRQDLLENMKYIYICELHFEEKFLNQNENRVRLINKMHPLATIFPETLLRKHLCYQVWQLQENLQSKGMLYNVRQLETDAYMKLARKSFSDINELEVLKVLGNDWECRRSPGHIVFYKMQINEKGIPKISQCIRIDAKMHVPLYVDNCPVPLPQWFRKGTTCILNLIASLNLKTFPLIWITRKKNFLRHLSMILRR